MSKRKKIKLVKRIKSKVDNINLTSGNNLYPPTPDLNEFMSGYKLALDKSEGQALKYLDIKYQEVFNELMPYPYRSETLLRVKVEYELLRRAWSVWGKPMSPKIEKNWRASQEYNINGFEDTMKSILLNQVGLENGGSKMANVKKKVSSTTASKTVKKESVVQAMDRLFTSNLKEKRTDEFLSKMLTKLFPEGKGGKGYDESHIKSHRSLYNKGKLSCQTQAPSRMLVPFDKKGEPLPVRIQTGKVGKVKTITSPDGKKKKVAVVKKLKLKKVGKKK